MASYGNNTFQYGADGIRYKKNNTEYTLDGNKILQEKDGTKTIKYYYGNGGVVGFNYNGTDYYYEKNLQGDITAIYNTSGVKQAEYVYDAWGKILSMTDSAGNDISNNTSHVGYLNPFRYRGYYYDVETDLYYLESRYYDPETGRFIQPADVSSLNPSNVNGLNLYSYANNNPISIAYSGSGVGGSIIGSMVSSIGSNNTFAGQSNSGSTSNSGLKLGWLADGLDTGSTIHGLYTSISGLVNHTAYFAQNFIPFADDMKMLGASMKDAVLAFNQFTWKFGKSDAIGVLLGVGLDVYDSIQREVSTGGVILGATLTAAKGVGLIYLNKGIMYGATAIGSCFGQSVQL